MEKNINPWTGKAKTFKNTGLFNQILYKHYAQLEKGPQANPYLEMIQLIETQSNAKNIDQYLQLFQLRSKIQKIDEISSWIDKVQNLSNRKHVEKQIPINSSFVYIPVYAYDTFQEILKDCSNTSKESIMSQQTVSSIKNEIKQMQKILEFNDKLVNSIL